MLNRLMKERVDLLLLLIRLTRKTALEYLLLVKAIRSTLKMEYFVKEWGKSIADHDENHESMMVNEADMDFRIPGQPHSVVKHAQSTNVRQLIQKIQNHPDRHALHQDGQGDGVPKAGLEQAAADSRGSQTCVCASTFEHGVAHAGEKDELTSCRGTV